MSNTEINQLGAVNAKTIESDRAKKQSALEAHLTRLRDQGNYLQETLDKVQRIERRLMPTHALTVGKGEGSEEKTDPSLLSQLFAQTEANAETMGAIMSIIESLGDAIGCDEE